MSVQSDKVLQFQGWKRVPDGYRTRTQWAKAGMRLRKNVQPAAEVCTTGHSVRVYDLFTANQVEPKQRRQLRPAEAEDLSPLAIGCALQVINKAAKRRRDAARLSYECGHHALAEGHQKAKQEYYWLKDAVLKRATEEGLAVLVGYHTKSETFRRQRNRRWFSEADEWEENEDEMDFDDEEELTQLACYELGGHRFHRIVWWIPPDAKVEVSDLGSWLSQAVPLRRGTRIQDAVATLRRYLVGGCVAESSRPQPPSPHG